MLSFHWLFEWIVDAGELEVILQNIISLFTTSTKVRAYGFPLLFRTKKPGAIDAALCSWATVFQAKRCKTRPWGNKQIQEPYSNYKSCQKLAIVSPWGTPACLCRLSGAPQEILNAVPEEKLLGYSQSHLSPGLTFTLEMDNLFLQHTALDNLLLQHTAFLSAPQVFPPPSKELAGTQQNIRCKPDLT